MVCPLARSSFAIFFSDGFSLLIKDREESQIVIKDEKLKEERIVLNIKNKDLSGAHAHYFDSIWRKSTPI